MRFVRFFALPLLVVMAGCSLSRKKPDTPRLNPNVRMFDSTIHSAILGRDMPLRIIVPVNVPVEAHLPVVYLLHGAGASYQAWSNYTDVAELAAKGMVLVMPEANGGFYINDRRGKHYRFEDYFMQEVIPETHRLVSYAATDRAHTTIVGSSRGGYGAIVLALKHPQTFGFVAGIAAAVDLPARPFIWPEFRESLDTLWSVGSAGSQTLLENDPFALARAIAPSASPNILLLCGTEDDLLDTNKSYAATLGQQKIPMQFKTIPGEHNWFIWNRGLPILEYALKQQFTRPSRNSD